MTIARYEVFQKVVELGNFTRAAEQLNMTQSAVSHAIASLEKEFGHSLLHRNKQAEIRRTEFANRIFPHIQSVLKSEAAIKQEVSMQNKRLEGTLKIGAFTSAAAQILPSMLLQLKKSYSGVKVLLFEGTYGEVMEWIDNGTVDIGFVLESNVNKQMKSILVSKDEIVLGLPKNHLLANQKTIDIQQIDGMDFIMPKGPYQPLVIKNLSDYQVCPNIILEVLNCETIVNMVSQNIGITMGPELFFKSHKNIEIKKLKQKQYRHIHLACKGKSPIIDAFFTCNQLSIHS
ncbi:LysR family transcriptional regulator [Bacillus pseudomycoides]|uniref:LysR family transcriptional regulator n=1 Tax=Bacillus pseudomycoides TaxID=64104 RepID=UPI000BEB954C|nr:LysR family transcriptional regulator [Bacillus pseudomycoides]PDY46465.1 LysR family transcriptional regulator [Bacillus pseudomycoides]PEA82069.1 LysR family transcriptional regulator [Bacillus pseudomycoides]PFZ06943.1 LysR family transcriptional regulator [Bacillus pseudomycoides]PGC45416.1 LysR family transcriptional regulator [Bacillus pseudomycoides]PGD26568.1 LysR family transcriptional regulator [Bacillus pseudomycoides]